VQAFHNVSAPGSLRPDTLPLCWAFLLLQFDDRPDGHPAGSLILPLFVLMVNIGLINTLPSVIIIYSGLLIPFLGVFAGQLLPQPAWRAVERGGHRRLHKPGHLSPHHHAWFRPRPW